MNGSFVYIFTLDYPSLRGTTLSSLLLETQKDTWCTVIVLTLSDTPPLSPFRSPDSLQGGLGSNLLSFGVQSWWHCSPMCLLYHHLDGLLLPILLIHTFHHLDGSNALRNVQTVIGVVVWEI